jgi:hypothetical protein
MTRTTPALAAGLFAAALLALARPREGSAAWDGRPAPVAIEAQRNQIDFRCGRDVVASYVTAPARAKPYFWPLLAPNGVPVTREPGALGDHPHQKSAWFCHGDVIPEGVELEHKLKGVEGVDFWSELPGHGRIVCTQVGTVDQVKNHGRVATENEWRSAEGVKLLDEARTIHLYNLGEARLFVLDIDLAAAVPVTFGDTKEGSLGVRVRDSLTEKKEGGRLTNAEGQTGMAAVWGRTSAWCDYSGTAEGTAVGVALFADPSNPYPTCWHARDYGLLAANPFGRAKSGFPAMKGRTDLVKLAKGEHLKLRYGILVHNGDVKGGRVAECYELFTKLVKR